MQDKRYFLIYDKICKQVGDAQGRKEKLKRGWGAGLRRGEVGLKVVTKIFVLKFYF